MSRLICMNIWYVFGTVNYSQKYCKMLHINCCFFFCWVLFSNKRFKLWDIVPKIFAFHWSWHDNAIKVECNKRCQQQWSQCVWRYLMVHRIAFPHFFSSAKNKKTTTTMVMNCLRYLHWIAFPEFCSSAKSFSSTLRLSLIKWHAVRRPIKEKHVKH